MVVLVFRLKLQLFANTFRRRRRQIVGMIIVSGSGLGVAGCATALLMGLRPVDAAEAGPTVILLGSVVTLGYFLIPLAVGADDILDPRRFSTFRLSGKKLAPLLLVAAMIGVPGLMIALVAGAQMVTWGRSPVLIVVSSLSALLIVTTSILVSRVAIAVVARYLATRRARAATGVTVLIAFVCLSPLLVFGARVEWSTPPAEVTRWAAWLGWSPLGAMWSAPADAAAGNVLAAGVKLAIAVTFAAILAALWRVIVVRMMAAPDGAERAKTYRGLGWFDCLPASPLGAIAARCFTYWVRDARYRVQLVIVPIVPTLMITVLMVGGIDPRMLALVPLPVICLFLGWSIHNDLAQDNTAMWLHLVSSVSGGADRFGRMVPVLALGGMLIAVGAPVAAVVADRPAALPVVVGVSVCILLSGLGFSSVSSARFPYAAVRPGDSPFTQPRTGTKSSSVVQALAFLATLLAASPSVVVGWAALHDGRQSGGMSMAVGVIVGVLVLGAGVLFGGRSFDRRGPELFAFAQRGETGA